MNINCDRDIRNKLDKVLEDNKIVIMSLKGCPPCKKAKELLTTNKLPYHDISLSDNQEFMDCLYEKTRSLYAPQIFINKEYIGGYQDLNNLHNSGKLYDYFD